MSLPHKTAQSQRMYGCQFAVHVTNRFIIPRNLSEINGLSLKRKLLFVKEDIVG